MSTPTGFLPLEVRVAGRECVVVGAGRIGTRRAVQLAQEGAHVVVVDPTPSSGLEAALDSAGSSGPVTGTLELRRASVTPGSSGVLVKGAFLVVTCTDDPELNEAVAQASAAAGALVSRADDAAASTLRWMGRADTGPLRVAVSSDGRAPGLTIWATEAMRNGLAELLGADAATLDALADLVAEVRGEWRSTMVTEPHGASELDWRSAIDRTMLDLISRGRLAEAKERLKACRSLS